MAKKATAKIWDIYVVNDGQTVSIMEGTFDDMQREIKYLNSTGDYGVLGYETMTSDQRAAAMKRLGWI
jgi:hypothetical protein